MTRRYGSVTSHHLAPLITSVVSRLPRFPADAAFLLPAASRFSPSSPRSLTPVAYAPGSPNAQPKDKVDPDHAAKMAKGTELFKTSRPRHPAGEVREVPQRRADRGRVRHGHARVAAQGRRPRAGGRARRPQEEPALPADGAPERAAHAARAGRSSPDADIAKIAEWIDLGAPYDKPLVDKDDAAWTKKVIAAEAKKHWAYQPLRGHPKPEAASREQPDRPLPPREARSGGAQAEPAGRQADADPPRVPRPDRPAADARGGRRVREGRRRRTRSRSWSIACSRRRTTASGGRGTGSTSPASPRATASSTTTTGPPPTTTATSSSRRSTRTCRSTRSRSGSSPATSSRPNDPLALMATGLPRGRRPQHADHQERGREAPLRRARRHARHHRHGVPRPDGRLRPLPRPQVRPDPAARLLPHAVHVHDDRPQRGRPRPRPGRATRRRRPRSTPSTRRSSTAVAKFEKEQLPGAVRGVGEGRGRQAAVRRRWVLPRRRVESKSAGGATLTQQADGSVLLVAARTRPPRRSRFELDTDLTEHHGRCGWKRWRTRRW